GGDLCDEPIVHKVVSDAPQRVNELIDWGMNFDKVSGGDRDDQNAVSSKATGNSSENINQKKSKGNLALGREGGHGHARILHADGDTTGRALAITMNKKVQADENIRLFEDCFVLDLITTDDKESSRCLGAITHHEKYGLQVIWAKSTILASGGCGQVFRE